MQQPGMITLEDPHVRAMIEEKQNQQFFNEQWNSGINGQKRLATDVLRTDMWKGKRCFVVGGGPSLKGFNFSMLDNEYSIAINRAYEYYNADILFAMDGRFYNWTMQNKYGKAARKKFLEFNGVKFWLDISNLNIHNVFYMKAIGRTGISYILEHGLFHGNNSGYGAFNLAIALGASPIYLLGFDMHFDNKGNGHFHDGHPVPFKEAMMKSFPTTFRKVAGDVKAKGIKVINCNPKSGLKCFEFGELPKNTGKKKRVIFVSYYTDNGYHKEIMKLRDDCWKLSIKTDFQQIKNQGSWIKNVQHKPVFIKRMLDKYPGNPIVWIDADARMRKNPVLFDKFKSDVGIHYRKKCKHGFYREELLSGTIYLANNNKTRELMNMWISENSKFPREWDQRTLAKVINKADCIIEKIPATYCQIFDSMKGEGGKPVIEHFQASRKYRRN